MKEPLQKRPRVQGAMALDENADFEAIAQWLSQMRLQASEDRDAILISALLTYPQTLVSKLLRYIAISELINLLLAKNFKIVLCLSEFIEFKTLDVVDATKKLFIFSCTVLENHELIQDAQLSNYWRTIHTLIKPQVLLALDVEVFSPLLLRASAPLFHELLPHLDDSRWLDLLRHNEYAFCRLLVRAPNIELTLTKLQKILRNHFSETHQAIMLALLMLAVKENCQPFFESYVKQASDYVSNLVMFNQCELLITACNSVNGFFLRNLLQFLPNSLRRNALALLATWLSVELNTAEIEHIHLRACLSSDLSDIMLLPEDLLSRYQYVSDEETFSKAQSQILKTRKSQISDENKRALLVYITLQSRPQTLLSKVKKHISERLNTGKHYCSDEIEIAVSRVINQYMGFEQNLMPNSQPAHQDKYQTFKETTLAKFSGTRSKKLVEIIEQLQTELVPYRTCSLDEHRRLVIQCLTLSEQQADTIDHIATEIESLSKFTPVVWLESLDISLWGAPNNKRCQIYGTNEHLALGSAILSQTLNNNKQPMLVASIGFFSQFEGNIKQDIRIPIRIEEKAVVQISANVNLLTEETDGSACEHPLKRLIAYLLHGKAMTKILQKAYGINRENNLKLVRAITLDCHTNEMPCEDCLKCAAKAQKDRTIVSKIAQIMASRKIKGSNENLPFLFRISLQSIIAPIQSQALAASPEMKLAPANSQLSPSTLFKPKTPAVNEANLSNILMDTKKTPHLVRQVNIQKGTAPERFQPKFFLKKPELLNITALCKQSIVMHKLKISYQDLEQKYSPDIKGYTALIGSCKH
jgi:hypothetical protein